MTALRPLTAFVALLLLAGLIAQPPPSPAAAQAPDDSQPTTLISPVAGNWTLLVNTSDAGSPETVLGSLLQLADSAFAFDATSQRFHSFRVAQPFLSDLDIIQAGQPFWVFVPPERLDGDITFWEQRATVRNLPVTLVPGFNLAAWTGTQGVRISRAVQSLPVRRAFLWDAVSQSFLIWDPGLPATLNSDFELEYGAGLWVDVSGTQSVTWEQP
jgi:hypothetical protein